MQITPLWTLQLTMKLNTAKLILHCYLQVRASCTAFTMSHFEQHGGQTIMEGICTFVTTTFTKRSDGLILLDIENVWYPAATKFNTANFFQQHI